MGTVRLHMVTSASARVAVVRDEGRGADGDLARPILAVQRRAWLPRQLEVVQVLQRIRVLESIVVENEILMVHVCYFE